MTKEELYGGKSKPRICEVLGVEPGEEWMVDGDTYDAAYRISFSGNLHRKGVDGKWRTTNDATGGLLNAINHPERIKRKPRWTAEDIGDAKAARRLFPEAEEVVRNSVGQLYLRMEDGRGHVIREHSFPSIRNDERAKLDEILEVQK